jgi:hypothetical protein
VRIYFDVSGCGSKSMRKTPEQIRTAGLAALKRELGVAGMVQFLQQFDRGSGNWAEERHAWVDRTTLADIRKATAKRRSRSRRAN